MNKKNISFYFDSASTEEWNWVSFISGNVAMNGTLSQFLLLVFDLSKNPAYIINFYSIKEIPFYKNIYCYKINSIVEAIDNANLKKTDLFIFNNKGNILQDVNESLIRFQIKSLLWDQNGPSPLEYDLISKNILIKRVICVSKTHANTYRHTKFFNKTNYVYNARDYSEKVASINRSKHNIAFIGAINDTKGFHWVAKAWPEIRLRYPNATLKVIGSIKTHDIHRKTGDLGISEADFENKYIKPYLGETRKEIEKNGVIFTGNIPLNQIFLEIENCNLGIVNPNTQNSGETFCVSALDFQSMGIPVIGGKTGGLIETISDNKTGILISQPEKLAKYIIDFFDKQIYDHFDQKEIQNFVSKNFNRATVSEKWIKIINEVINDVPNEPLKFNFKEAKFKDYIKEIIRVRNIWTK